MKYLIISLILYSAIGQLHAQNVLAKDSLINNLDIGWVGEYEFSIPFDISADTFYQKFISPDDKLLYLSENSYNTSKNGHIYALHDKIKYFSSYTLKEKHTKNNISYEFFSSLKSADLLTFFNKKNLLQTKNIININEDRIILFDKKQNEYIQIITTDKISSSVQIKLLVYYNIKNNNFNALCTEIAPVIKNEHYSYLDEPVLWIPAYSSDTTLDYQNNDITYAKNTRLSLKFSDAKVLKTLFSPNDAIANIYSAIRENPSEHKIYPDWIGLEAVTEYPLEYKNKIGKYIDTMYIDDYESFSEETKIITTYEDGREFEGYSFEINWYWDSKKKKLLTNTLAFAPLKSKYIGYIPTFFKKVCKGNVYIAK